MCNSRESGILITLEKIKGSVNDDLYVELIEELLQIVPDDVESLCPCCCGEGQVEEWWGHPEAGPPHIEVIICPLCKGKKNMNIKEMLTTQLNQLQQLQSATVSTENEDEDDDIEF
jgi:hypothetical protein